MTLIEDRIAAWMRTAGPSTISDDAAFELLSEAEDALRELRQQLFDALKSERRLMVYAAAAIREGK